MNEVLIAGFGVSHKGVGLSVNTMHDGTTITFTSGAVSYTHLTLPTNREV